MNDALTQPAGRQASTTTFLLYVEVIDFKLHVAYYA